MSQGTLISCKAGRAFRREGTNFVDAKPDKGLLSVTLAEDGLLRWQWRNRTTNEIEDDLIIFPADSTFTKVLEANGGRMFVLKFSSSDQRHFYWLQDAYTARDKDYENNFNALLQDPSHTVTWTAPAAPSAGPSTSFNPNDFSNLHNMIQGFQAGRQGPDVFLSDILTPANVEPLFQPQNAHILETLFPHLPPDLPSTPDAATVRRIIESPQFQSSVRQLDEALATGMLAGLVISLGLPAEAGTGVGPFLRAIREKANRERAARRPEEESMETD